MNCQWERMLLGDFVELKRGYDLPKKNRSDGSVPLVSSAGVSDSHGDAKVSGPGVVTGRYGTIGEVFFIEEDFWPLNTTLYVRDFKGNDPRFVYYFLKTIDYSRYSDKAAVPGVNRNHLHQAEIYAPTCINEQRNIADFLGALDDKIQLNNQINQTLEQIAQALFKSWFVDFEPVKAKIAAKARWQAAQPSNESASPVCYADELEPQPNTLDLETTMNLAAMQAISGKDQNQLVQMQAEQPEQYAQLQATAALFPSAMEESELGDIPEGWEAMPLYEAADYVNGAAFKATDFSSDRTGLPVIKIAELKQGISESTKFTLSSVKEKYLINDGDVLYSWSGSPDTSLEVFKWFGGEGYLNQHIFKLNFKSMESKHFTYFLLKEIKPLLISTAKQKQTTGLGHITVADMKRIKVPVPSSMILSVFSTVVAPLYDRASNAVQESALLSYLRDNLLPKLLSGELTLPEAEHQAREATDV